MDLSMLLRLAEYSDDDYIYDPETGEATETSFLQEDDVLTLHNYYEVVCEILDRVVKGKYKFISCNGNADYPYCIVNVEGDVIGYTEDDRLYGIHFEEVTGNFDCSNGGLTHLNCGSNCGSGMGFWCLIDILHGDLIADNNNLQNLNGMCEVRGNVYVRGNKDLKCVKQSYNGFWALESKVPMERIFADIELVDEGWV